jgi:hypothetical protein
MAITKASKRIEKAKAKYKAAEDKADSLLLRLAANRWTLPILVAAAAIIVAILVIR